MTLANGLSYSLPFRFSLKLNEISHELDVVADAALLLLLFEFDAAIVSDSVSFFESMLSSCAATGNNGILSAFPLIVVGLVICSVAVRRYC